MEVALPAGDTQNVFPILRLMLSSFQCIIWLALASFSEIPVVVRLFLSSNDIRLTVPQVFLILNLNGLFFSYPFFFSHARARSEADSSLQIARCLE